MVIDNNQLNTKFASKVPPNTTAPITDNADIIDSQCCKS